MSGILSYPLVDPSTGLLNADENIPGPEAIVFRGLLVNPTNNGVFVDELSPVAGVVASVPITATGAVAIGAGPAANTIPGGASINAAGRLMAALNGVPVTVQNGVPFDASGAVCYSLATLNTAFSVAFAFAEFR